MTQPYSREPRLSARAAAVLVTEFSRHPGPKSAVLVGVDAGSPVLTEAINALLPGDTLTVVVDGLSAGVADEAALTRRVAEEGSWVAQRVQMTARLSDAKPGDVVLVGRVLDRDTAELAANELRETVAPGGVLCLPTVATPGQDVKELANSAGSDLVLWNRPFVRVHRLRFSPGDLEIAERLEPAFRPSSVPLPGQWRIDSNGVAAAAIFLGAAAVAKRARPRSKLWLIPALAAVPVAAFFRDPERVPPEDPKAVVSGCDGQVLAVERLVDDRFGSAGHSDWLRISVFLSVLDVHVNRSPVAGRVVEVIRETGGYAPAMKPSAEHNVAAYTVLETTHGPAVVAQRTGLLARRIVNRTRPGMLLARGERFGLIRFGSRTDVYLPAESAEALVAPAEKVVGGESVIARWL
ncbi:MAG: phosphatidylserine decarboxylase family protein [Micromonosporaceae bacterium]|nr:phosphatidylserine decarboxylase family protein [Micromonosporaceae bacterium]